MSNNFASFGISPLEYQGYKTYFEKLKEGSENVRAIAAFALGQIGDKKTSDQIIETLENDKSSIVKIECIRALSIIKDEKAVNSLIKALKDDNSSVRAAAATAVGIIKSKEAVSTLLDALHDMNTEVRVNALDSLAEIGSKNSAEHILKKLNDPEAQVRRHAVGALGVLSDEKSITKLIEMFDDDDAITRMMAAWSLGEIGEIAVDPLLRIVETSGGENRLFAVEALTIIGSEKALPVLKKLANEGNDWIVNVAKSALEKLNS